MALRRLSDGTVLSSNLLISDAPTPFSRFNNHGISKAMILRKIPKDDAKNISKKMVEYEAIIVSGPRHGEIVRGVAPMDSFGGQDNFNEVVYSPKTRAVKGSDLGDKTLPNNTDGSYVLLGFVNGYDTSPIILGGCRQPNNSGHGAEASDGNRIKGAFQGLQWLVDDDGVLTISHGDTSIQLDDQGNVNITTGTKTTITSSGDVEVNSSGSTEINSTSDTTINSAAAVNVSSATGITFGGPFVKLGSSGASESVILGDLFKSYFDGHVHGGSGTPPTTPMPDSTLSDKSKVE